MVGCEGKVAIDMQKVVIRQGYSALMCFKVPQILENLLFKAKPGISLVDLKCKKNIKRIRNKLNII